MRTSCIERNTKETQISLLLNLDGGDCEVDTGIGFFDHMLTAFSVHGGFGLKLTCRGDLNVDCHHTIEDVGIALGKAFSEALGDKGGIMRYGSFLYRWTRPWDFAPQISAADRFLCLRQASPRSVSAHLTPVCAKNFSVPLP